MPAAVTEAQVRRQVRGYLRSALSMEVGDDTDIFKSGFVNSLFAAQLVLFVEKQYELTVDSEDMEVANFSSVTAIADYVLRKNARINAW
jgi:methoxymalonate biosynthesis acyl carrier protein